MRYGMKEISKKVFTVIAGGGILLFAMGMTALAATNGTISGSLAGSTGYAWLYNKSGNDRYCNLIIREYDKKEGLYTTIASNGGVISSGNMISTNGKITKAHAQGIGTIYNSASPSSGFAKTLTTSIK